MKISLEFLLCMSPLHRVMDGKLKVSPIIPGLTVQYTTDNGHTWRDISNETFLSRSVKIGTRLVSSINDVRDFSSPCAYTEASFLFFLHRSADRRRMSRLVEIKFQEKITRSSCGSLAPSVEFCLLFLTSLMPSWL